MEKTDACLWLSEKEKTRIDHLLRMQSHVDSEMEIEAGIVQFYLCT